MAYRNYIAALILGAGVFIALPAVNAAKPPKPVDELEARVEALEGDVAVLSDEVAGLSETVAELSTQIPQPRPVLVDANGTVIGPLVDFETTPNGGSNFFLRVGGNYAFLNAVIPAGLIKAFYPYETNPLFFDGSGCTGNAYTRAHAYGGIWNGRVLANLAPAPASVAVQSDIWSGGCRDISGSVEVYALTDIGPMPEFTPPFSVRVR
jgi:hypothetical protein